MFRTQQNAFDDVVAKATDENLTSENWEYILDVCDKVQAADNGSKDVVSAMIKRLAHRNANVQLYTLELANSLSQNCGVQLHRELASRSFTDALSRLAGDRTTHQQVKSKIVERMEEWTRMFENNTELGIMKQAYQTLKSQNPNLQPPQAPTKRMITQYDKQKEEEELQMALKLSIQENKTQGPSKSAAAELSGQPSTSTAPVSQAPTAASHVLPSGTTAATVSRVRALYDFVPSEQGELQFRKGDVIAVLESVYKDWWKGSLRGQTGIFPLNYVEKLSDPTQEELQREAQMEAEVFGQIKNVERLLALLSTNAGDVNARDNEEITELYHGTLAIRPKLIELIGKYTQKKDDFQQLNEKFIKARRDYEALLESSMAQSAQQYGRAPSQPYGYGGSQGYQSQPHYYTSDGQPPKGGMPPQQYPPTGPPQFQAPYPSATPVPQSHTPAPAYPLQLQASGRRQSYHSDHHNQPSSQYPSHQPQEMSTSIYDSPTDPQAPHRQSSYPPPTVSGIQGSEGRDYYSPSVYSQESAQYPAQTSEPTSYPPQSQAIPPLQHQSTGQSVGYASQSQAPYAPSQAPPPAPSHAPPIAPSDHQRAQSPPYQGFAPPSQGIGAVSQQGGPHGSVTYQAYQPPQQAAGAGGPAGFYR